MKEEISIFEFQKKLPLNFTIVKCDSVFTHMHSNPQLLIFLKGTCKLVIDKKTYEAKPNDMVIINGRTFHSIKSDDETTLLSVIIDPRGFSIDEDEADTLNFNLNTMENPNNPRYESIRYLVYSIIKYNTMENVNSIHTNRAIAFSLFAQLMNDFQKSIKESYQVLSYDVITEITAFINDFYKKNLTLSDIAKTFKYSEAYLSRLFKSSLGKNFTDYYDEVRTNYSLQDLAYTNKTIEEIAEENGFSDSRSFVRSFKKIFDKYPSEYRKESRKSDSKSKYLNPTETKKEVLDMVFKYYNEYNASRNEGKEETRDTEELVSVNYQGQYLKIDSPQTNILQFGNASFLLNDEVKECLAKTQKEIGFTHILITGLFDLEFKMLSMDENSNYRLNFIFIDKILEFLKSINLKPYFKLSFSFNIFTKDEYMNLINSLIDHLATTYTEDDLNNFYFSINLDHGFEFISNDRFASFFNLYRDFHKTFSEKLKSIKVVSPTFEREQILTNPYLYHHFFDLCKKSKVTPDFISISFIDPTDKNTVLPKEKDELKQFMNYLRSEGLFYDNKIIIENFNFTSQSNLLNDTVYVSSYLAKNLIENIKSIAGFGKLSFTDLSSTSPLLTDNPFNGSSGIFTYNSIKKPSYNAYKLFAKLQGYLLKKSSNYIVTKSHNKLVIMFNNYNHYSNLYAENEYYKITNLDRYSCFPKSTNIHYKLSIENLHFTKATVKITALSQESGSAFDKWVEMSNGSNLTPAEFDILRNISEMNFKLRKYKLDSSTLNLDLTLAPLETKVIEIKFYD